MVEQAEQINFLRREIPERPLLNRLWMRVEETLAISSGLAAAVSLYPSEFNMKLNTIGGIALGLGPEINFDTNYLLCSVILASSYGVARGVRVGVRETIRMIDTLPRGV